MTTNNNIMRKIAKWTAGVLCLLLALVLAGTWLINHGPIQEKIKAAVERQTAGIVTFRHLDLSLLPRPHLTLNDAALTVPGKVQGQAASASIYPEVLPLFSRNVRIAKISLDAPDFTFLLAEESPAVPEDSQATFLETRTELESVLSSVRGIAPDFIGEVREGKIVIRGEHGKVTMVKAINGTLGLIDKGFDVRMTAQAPHWGHVAAKGSLLVGKNSIAVKNATLSGGRSSVSGLSARFGWRVTPWLSISSGGADHRPGGHLRTTQPVRIA